MEQSLHLRQQQRMILTPELRQAIELLQLPTAGLEQLVAKELAENPFLEVGEEGRETEAATETQLPSLAEWLEFRRSTITTTSAGVAGDEENDGMFEAVGAKSLYEELLHQLELLDIPEDLREVADFLAGCVDSAGYLRADEADVAMFLAVDRWTVDAAVQVLQGLEPAGIGARDLAECLRLQLVRRDQLDSVTAGVLDHLTLIGEGHYRQLAKVLGCSLGEVQCSLELLRTLDPRPGSAYGAFQAGMLRPDLLVEASEQGWRVRLMDDGIPPLLVVPYGKEVMRDSSPEAKAFLEARYLAAVGLVRGIWHRRQTLLRIGEAIIAVQGEFLKRGAAGLKPLTLKQVAEQAAVHESTVSRAVASKTMATPRGIIPLRTFFSAALGGGGGAAVSATAAKGRIKELIQGEDVRHPLSDQYITDVLNKEGVDISRRTVAKYREELGILSSSQRKRHMAGGR